MGCSSDVPAAGSGGLKAVLTRVVKRPDGSQYGFLYAEGREAFVEDVGAFAQGQVVIATMHSSARGLKATLLELYDPAVHSLVGDEKVEDAVAVASLADVQQQRYAAATAQQQQQQQQPEPPQQAAVERRADHSVSTAATAEVTGAAVTQGTSPAPGLSIITASRSGVMTPPVQDVQQQQASAWQVWQNPVAANAYPTGQTISMRNPVTGVYYPRFHGDHGMLHDDYVWRGDAEAAFSEQIAWREYQQNLEVEVVRAQRAQRASASGSGSASFSNDASASSIALAGVRGDGSRGRAGRRGVRGRGSESMWTRGRGSQWRERPQG